MKRLFLITLVAICCSCGSSSKQKPQSVTPSTTDSQSDLSSKPEPPVRQGWYLGSLYGDVKSVTLTEYKLVDKFGEIVRDDVERCEKYYFNAVGNVTGVDSYHSDGSLWNKRIYKYDASGNLIEDAWYDSDGSLRNKQIYKYNTLGNKIEYVHYNSDGSLYLRYTYKYNDLGNKIEEDEYDSDVLSKKTFYNYDSRGNLIEMTEYSGNALIPTIQTVFEITYRN
jgi:hypothetical protein